MSLVRFDAGTLSQCDGTNPWEFSHTTAAGASLLLVLVYSAALPSVAVTYGGLALTLISEDAAKDLMVYGLLNPPSGANTVHLEWPSNRSADIVVYTFLGSESKLPTVVGYDQDAGYVETGVVTKDARTMVADMVRSSGTSYTPGAGQTVRAGDPASNSVVGSTTWATDPSFGVLHHVSWTINTLTMSHVVVAVDAPDEGVPAGFTPVVGH